MNAPTPRQSNLGCPGCLSMGCLTIVLLVELAAVWWLNPNWFDQVAFWRGPKYEPHLKLVDHPASRARLESEVAAARARPAPGQPAGPVPFSMGRIETRYEPAQGADLAFSDRASLRVPAGAIAGTTTISMTPMLAVSPEMAAPFAGPVVDIRIGDREHYDFRKPVTLTLPYEPAGEHDRPSLAYWNGSHWEEVPSQVDTEQKTLSAELSHASTFSSISISLWMALEGTSSVATQRALSAVFAAAAASQATSSTAAASTTMNVAGASLSGSTLNIGAAASSTAAAGASFPVWAVVGTVAAVGGAVGGTSTGRSAAASTWWWMTGGKEYETPRGNFKIHYVTEDEDAVPDDVAFRRAQIPFEGKGTPEGHPLYVRYLGELLEDCLRGFNKMGLAVPRAKRIRHDVFVENLGGEFGSSHLGGPMFLSNRLLPLARDMAVPADEMIRFAVAHDLTHVAQDEHFNAVTARYSSWFVEMMASYVGFRYWENQKRPLHGLQKKFLLNNAKVPIRPMDTFGNEVNPYYVFPRWLDRNFGKGSGLRFLLAASESWLGNVVDLEDLNKASRSMKRGVDSSLSDLFTRFALDYYHNDLWDSGGSEGQLFPEVHGFNERRALISAKSNVTADFMLVTDGTPGRGQVQAHAWAAHQFGAIVRGDNHTLPHLSAEWATMEVDRFPETQLAKLVVRVEAHDPVSPDFALYFANGVCDEFVPGLFDPPPMQRLPVAQDAPQMFVVDRVGQLREPNCVSMVAVNRSFEQWVTGANVQRWLLVPPDHVSFWRTGDYDWRVEWDEVGLKNYPEVWGKYQVLRKEAGQPDSEFVPIDRTDDEFYDAGVLSRDDYVFTVRVIDAYDNESHPAKVPDRDPFAGKWFGIVREAHGLYLSEMSGDIEAAYKKKISESWSKIHSMPENTARERQLKRDEKASLEFMQSMGDVVVQEIASLAPVAAKVIRTAGLPVVFKIERRDGDYFGTVVNVAGIPVSDPALTDVALKSTGFRALGLRHVRHRKMADFELQSPRDDYIRSYVPEYFFLKQQETDRTLSLEFKWWFWRGGVP